jgi:hypothetical protein
MKKFKFTLRLLTLACYFAPFVFYMSTCVGDEFRSAYNKEEAFKNIAEAQGLQMVQLIPEIEEFKKTINSSNRQQKLDSLRQVVYDRFDPFTSADRVNIIKDSLDENLKQELLVSLIYPTNYSVSGIAVFLDYKNKAGQIMLIISGILSLAALLFWSFFQKRNLGLYMQGLNLVCVASFMIDGLVHDIDILWGCWALFVLLIIQLIIEERNLAERNKMRMS